MTRPLEGLLVVSLEQAVAAPYASRMLADQGARVVKVERPDGGDFARHYDTRARGNCSHFVWVNRSKESLTLDLKRPEAVAALKRLLIKADVFIQNLAPGAADRLGLGQEELREANERLITCSISGYGEGGPYSGRKAYDLLIQAEAGFLSVTGWPGKPVKAGVSVADIAAGIAAYNGVLTALLARHRTGRGDHIEVSMLEAMAEWMGFPMYFATDGASPPVPAGAGHATIFPYGPYDTADGTVLFSVQNEREWAAFCRVVLGKPELAEDPRFRGSAARHAREAETDAEINAVLSTLTTEEAIARLEEARIATASVNDMAGLWAHPQLAARGRWQDVALPGGHIPALKPLTGEGWEPRLDPIPELGADTDAILEELGMDPAEAAAAKGEGA